MLQYLPQDQLTQVRHSRLPRLKLAYDFLGPLFAVADAFIITTTTIIGSVLYWRFVLNESGDLSVFLGMGLVTGMAYADKIQGGDRRTFLVLSDGEMQEGSTWEAMMMAANLNLDNLVAFIDLNDFGGLARMSEGHPAFYPVLDKIRAFGWETVEVNGHDAAAVGQAVVSRSGKKPFMVVGKTVKGKGVSFMEHVNIWHYRSPNKEEYATAMAELAEVTS